MESNMTEHWGLKLGASFRWVELTTDWFLRISAGCQKRAADLGPWCSSNQSLASITTPVSNLPASELSRTDHRLIPADFCWLSNVHSRYFEPLLFTVPDSGFLQHSYLQVCLVQVSWAVHRLLLADFAGCQKHPTDMLGLAVPSRLRLDFFSIPASRLASFRHESNLPQTDSCWVSETRPSSWALLSHYPRLDFFIITTSGLFNVYHHNM